MKRIVVFASGSGSNFQAIIDAADAGRLNAEIAGLITNRVTSGAKKKAEKAGIPVEVLIPPETGEQSGYEMELLRRLDRMNPDLIVLAGYLVKIPDPVIDTYRNRIINIHPSLLPRFGGKGYYGKRVHRAVLEAGEKESGCSVHIVNEVFDNGPVIAQKKVPVMENDTPETLADRILKEEHKLLPDVIAKLLTEN